MSFATDIILLLAGYWVTAYFAVLYGRQVSTGTKAHKWKYIFPNYNLILQLFDQLLLVKRVGQVFLVAQHEHGDALQLGLVQQLVQLVSGRLEFLVIRCIHHVAEKGEWEKCPEEKTDTHTIAFTPRQYRSHIDRNLGWPPMSQSWKGSSDAIHLSWILYLYRNISLCDLAHVEANGRDHVLRELATLRKRPDRTYV